MKSDDSSDAEKRDPGSAGRRDEIRIPPGQSTEVVRDTLVLRVETAPPPRPRRFGRWIRFALIMSILLNVLLLVQHQVNYQEPVIPEHTMWGDLLAADRIAVINFSGTISPPFTERWIRQIKRAAEDSSVRGVILAIDSPGGLVADSHQIYHELQKLTAAKPVYVSMKRLAASGGYYIAMGIGPEGQIFAEPTTWTGSIGVIIPRYNATELAKTVGVKVEPLVTGEFKDTLNPFRDMTDAERALWGAILKDSFDRFVTVISANRAPLNEDGVRQLATGQIYTANQALDNHLVDQIGYLEDAAEALASKLQLNKYKVFEYRETPGLVDLLMGAQTAATESPLEQLLDAAVPKALYYCSWNPWVPVRQ